MISSKWLQRTAVFIFLGLVGLFAQRMPHPTLANQATQSEATVQSLVTGENGLSFVLNTPAFSVDALGQLAAAGLNAHPNQSGAPDVPFYSTYIALPPEATVTVNAAASTTATRHTVPTLRPIPTGSLDTLSEALSLSHALNEQYQPDAALYQQDQPFPGSLYTLSEPMYVRDVRLVRLDLHPLQYNPAQQQLTHLSQITVSVTFHGADFTALQPADSYQNQHLRQLEPLLLNPAQASQWRSLPATMAGAPTTLPVGQTAYKIAITQDGIHELSYATLGVTGSHDPSSIQMVYRGEPVAFTFINGGGTANFDHPNDRVRFYGWQFASSRHEQQYVEENIFWLWLGGAAASIADAPNVTGLPAAASFPESITAEQDNRFTSAFLPQELWLENEPDGWYWDLWVKAATPITRTYGITITHPVTSGGNITFTTEILSRGSTSSLVNTYLNYADHGSSYQATRNWNANRNVNIVGNAPASALINGQNLITIGTHSPGSGSRNYLLNRLTIDYQRLFIADGDQLFFTYPAGSQQYNIDGYSQNAALIWNITDPHHPINITDATITGSGPYTYHFGTNNSQTSRFIATTTANIITVAPAAVTNYVVNNLDPATGQADWLVVTHGNFMAAAASLAAHRQQSLYGGYQTHIVNIADITEQYGYGLQTPSALHSYLSHALANWDTAPTYVLLIGDTHVDMRHRWVGNGAPAYWNANETSYLNTDLLMVDRYQGLVPTDHSFVLLSGNDILPDMSIGRLAVQTLAEATAAVNKIITYEENHIAYIQNQAAYAWLGNILFTADEFDPAAGDFCHENNVTAGLMPANFDITAMCLGTGPGEFPSDALMQAAMKDEINLDGLSLLNYRGHGSVDNWSGTLLATTTPNFWQNEGKPVVTLSMDCLDAHFVFPGFEGLGESLVAQPPATSGELAAAAHWSSTGLGLTFEHNYLARGFYEGLWAMGHTAIGDGINYAKLIYWQTNLHASEMFSFTLHGDPAMQLFRPALSLTQSVTPASTQPGQTVQFTFNVTNQGLYPSLARIVNELPAGFSYVSHTSSIPSNVTTVGQELTVQFEATLAAAQTATVTITAQLAPTYNGPTLVTNSGTVSGTGLEGAPGNETASVFVVIIIPEFSNSIYLPIVFRAPFG